MTCQRARTGLAGSGLPEDLDSILDHAEACEECRSTLGAAFEADPDALLAFGAALPPAPDWRGFNARVLSGIEADSRRGWRAKFADWILAGPLTVASAFRPRAALAVTGAAAAVLLALVLMLPGGPAPIPGGSAPMRVAGAGAPAGIDDPSAPGLPDSARSADANPAPVEAVASPTAHVVQMQLDAHGGAGDFVLIVDEGMGL